MGAKSLILSANFEYLPLCDSNPLKIFSLNFLKFCYKENNEVGLILFLSIPNNIF